MTLESFNELGPAFLLSITVFPSVWKSSLCKSSPSSSNQCLILNLPTVLSFSHWNLYKCGIIESGPAGPTLLLTSVLTTVPSCSGLESQKYQSHWTLMWPCQGRTEFTEKKPQSPLFNSLPLFQHKNSTSTVNMASRQGTQVPQFTPHWFANYKIPHQNFRATVNFPIHTQDFLKHASFRVPSASFPSFHYHVSPVRYQKPPTLAPHFKSLIVRFIFP